ncbi:MAG: MaoC family dehydratase N-terminal domain-containing protein [Gammaproteobacteria bacterium]|nr:MaoC family dehydratase N-terminal domain-containing protein [Gammaproteobacteria bacterium]
MLKLEEAASAKLQGPEFTVRIEHGKIREFATSIASTHQAYLRSDRPVAPVYFLITAGFFWGYTLENPVQTVFSDVDIDRRLLLHAGEEIEFEGPPPSAGDVLTAKTHIADVYTRDSARSGTMTFIVTETAYRNADGGLVARQRTTLVRTTEASGHDS